jgi:hypothetical protein
MNGLGILLFHGLINSNSGGMLRVYRSLLASCFCRRAPSKQATRSSSVNDHPPSRAGVGGSIRPGSVRLENEERPSTALP